MLPDKRDDAYLWDMREAARDCVEFVSAATYERFCEDKMMHSAVERRLEILGEAAGRVSEGFQLRILRYPGRRSKAFGLSLLTGTVTLTFMKFGKPCEKIFPT